ncbi:MAG: CsoS2 family carboxysome shell protein [Actinomycetota bacterium]|nr:CsoS2 family carboxysome shell protein [Actinomycetota bacterium]
MGMYAVDTADAAELGELRDAARGGRAVATLRRRQLSQGKQALNGAGTPAAGENLQANGAGAAAADPNGQGEPNGTQAAQEERAVPTDAVAAAHFGRSVSIERRRQMSQGKQALNRAGALPTAENRYVNGAGAAPAANGQGAPADTQGAQEERPVPTDAVAAAHSGRLVSMQRRRQMSQGKVALNSGGAPPAPENSQGNGAGAPLAARGQGASNTKTAAPTDAVAAAHFGRSVSMERRRQLSQGKQALKGAGALPAPESVPVDVDAGSGRDRARARRAEASRLGSEGISRPQRQGRVRYVPKVIESPTYGGQHVTGVRIAPGVQVTGGEPGSSHPISGTQYVPADGPAPAPGAGVKVGLMRTPQGLVVSGTTVRGNVPITGDEAGEHLPITGEADQRPADDLTPRTDGAYRSAQFPRRADPHGASAVGGRLGVQPAGPALENSDDGLAVTGTAVGRSGRVTGNEAGACRPVTGDQYQNLYSTECGAIGGGTAPADHLGRARLDPVTAGKVTLAQTWRGQQVTGPSLEYRANVTGDEPGDCRPVTGTPYQGPSTIFGACEPEEADPATQRLEPRPGDVAVTGDLPMHSKLVTGIERGYRNDITGSSYYGEMRPAEAAADDWVGASFPGAQARRLAGRDASAKEINAAAAPASSIPGRITGTFAISAGRVTGNSEFLFRPRTVQTRDDTQTPITGEGRTDGRAVTGTAAAWTSHDLVTGTEGYIAAGRNPTEGGGPSNAWAGARRFKDLATPGRPNENARVTGRVGGTSNDGVRVTVSGGAQG